ncbi:MAG: TonB-dependent receptor [Acidobacteria bacterium]|nr:TonB-dependent receptor [Acidobacteriota bacterium]
MLVRSTRIFFFATSLILLIMFFTTVKLSQAQVSQNLAGKILDPTNAPLKKVTVSLLSAKQTVIAKTETDEEGRFSFSNIASGNYLLEAYKSDFGTQRFVAEITEGSKDLELTMEINPLSDHITITAETGQVSDTGIIPQQVNVISDDAIRQRSTGVLAQVADEEEGIFLQRTSPTIGSVYVRGLTGRYVSVYVDGVRYTTGSQRGGINTFFNLNEPSNLRAVEVLRGPNSAQYGSGSIGGTVQLVSQVPGFGSSSPEFHGEFNTFFTSADLSYGANSLVTYGTRKYGLLLNLASRRINTLRPGKGIDTHSAITRFLGIPSNVLGDKLTDTAFTQYGGTAHFAFAPTVDSQIIIQYKRNQQDAGKRYDQTLGGDGNLIADLRNLMLDFGYARFNKQNLVFFDSGSFTFSFNSQREERVNQGGQGNPLASITSQYERTNVFGFNFFLDKRLNERSTVLIGADVYNERVDSPAFTFNPASKSVTPSRPRIPDNARYTTYGFYVQNGFEAIPNRLRFSSALRFGVSSYKVRSKDSVIVRGQPLFPDDSVRVDDFSGRIGLVATPIRNFNVIFNYSRGFNAPNTTELGTLGLTGDGFEVSTEIARALNGTIGSVAGDRAVSTGISVSKIKSELSNNFDLGLRFHNRRIDTEITGFIIDINDPIVKQSLILPQGAVGKFLGDQPIVRQLPNGVVFVPLSASPVLVRTNFADARSFGFEYRLEAKLTSKVTFTGNVTYIRSKDKATGAPPNIEGGTPPTNGFLSLRYAPQGKRYWVEAYATLANRQDRLSSLDLADRRTGAPRSRSNIANFFNNGARVRGLIGVGADGRFGTADDILIPTGETLAQVQNRVVGNTTMSIPMFPELPGYGLFNLRGGFKINESSNVSFDFENIGDKNYRGVSWGIDGPGRSVTIRYSYKF